MAKGKLDMAAFNKSMNSLDKAFVERLDKIEKAFVKSMETMEAEATAAAPLGKTGKLKASIKQVEIGKLSYQLRADVPYAAFVEFGTGPNFSKYKGKDAYWQDIAEPFKGLSQDIGKTEPRAFFYTTVNKNIPKLKTRIKTILSKNA